VLHVAAWDEDTVLEAALTGHNDSRVVEGGGTRVMAYDIGEWFRRALGPKPCDHIRLKMDIEGAEVQAIGSLERAGVLPLVDHLIVEWHDHLMPDEAKGRLIRALSDGGLAYAYATLDGLRYTPGESCLAQHCDSHYFRAHNASR
jgi:hypothetical protein